MRELVSFMQTPRDQQLSNRRHDFSELSIDKMVASILAVLIAVPSPISYSLSLGGAISLALSPVTIPALWRNVRGRWFVITTLALVPIGWLVAQFSLSQETGREFSLQLFLYEAAVPVGLLAIVSGAYWCIAKLGLERFLFLSFAGLLMTAWFTQRPDNPWKYGLALPISMLLILVVARNRPLLGLAATLLISVSVATNFRTWIGVIGLAMLFEVFRPRRFNVPSATKASRYALLISAVGLLTMISITQLSAAGMLGDYIQRRTTSQLAAGNGNLLLGGRPEWGAAFAILRESPLGVGVGITPSSDDYWLAIRNMPLSSGLQQISTVATSFHEGVVNFHSTFWNFWSHYGVAGVAFSILSLVFFVQATMVASAQLTRLNLRVVVTILMLSSTWDILFSPTRTAQLGIALATALHLLASRIDTNKGVKT